jgi:hypothetical protein
VQHFQDRVVAGLGARGERLVQALAAEASAFGNRAHAARLGDMANRSEEDVRVGGLERRRQILRHDFVVIKKRDQTR